MGDSSERNLHGKMLINKTNTLWDDSSQHKSHGATLVNKTLMGRFWSTKLSLGDSSEQNS